LDTRKTFLALGDSYTIGEGISQEENFPSQTIHLLNTAAIGADSQRPDFEAPVIIAKTGWTTDELDAAIDDAGISKTFDFVSLLIGVNNQYRGRSVSDYKVQFDQLLQRAIGFAANNAKHVFVLSIPDWGTTPFADGQDREKIAGLIDSYNNTAKDICLRHKIVYIDITSSQRTDGKNAEFLAPDLLHPSGKEYLKWAVKLAEGINNEIA
jgi:lysophospholipase L1-like esterase